MTDSELNENRLTIIKEFLATGEKLFLDDLNLTLSSSSAGIYHVYENLEHGKVKFLYSISDLKLAEIAQSLKIRAVKKFFIEGRVLRLRNKFLAENESPRAFNPLDFEGYK